MGPADVSWDPALGVADLRCECELSDGIQKPKGTPWQVVQELSLLGYCLGAKEISLSCAGMFFSSDIRESGAKQGLQ